MAVGPLPSEGPGVRLLDGNDIAQIVAFLKAGKFSNLTLDTAGFLIETSANGITAGTTRTQAGATVLTAEVNRVDTSTAPSAGTILGDGVALPPTQPGLDITVINNTANPIQVYGQGADTINGVTATTGVALPPGDVAHFECAAVGDWRFDPGFGATGALPTMLSNESITAVNPVAQNTAFQIAAVINHVTTVNVAGAAVALPAAKYGLEVAIENATANPLTVYPVNGGSDTINGLAANASVVIPGFTTVLFRAASAGTWQSDPYVNAVGALPSTGTVAPGSAVTGAARSGGNLSVQSSSAGVGNAAATTNTVLMTYQLPANAFDVAGRQIAITAAGKFAANGNNKVVQIYVGTDTQTVGNAIVTTATTSIATSGVVTTNNGGWVANALVTKYGANGSNTQLGVNLGIVAGASHTGTSAPVLLTATESGVINITVTGASSTTGAANDVLAQLMDVAFAN